MSQSIGIVIEKMSRKYHVVYLQLTNAHNEITAGISYNLRRKMEPSFGEYFGLCLINKVDSQPIIIFKEVFFGLL